MTVTVHLFASLREAIGHEQITLDLPAAARVQDLKATLSEQYPAVGLLIACSAVAVNHDYATDDQPLTTADEIGLIPPVSGGQV